MRTGIAKRWVLRTFYWPGILEVGQDTMILRVLSRRGEDIRTITLYVPLAVIWFLGSFIIWNKLELYLVAEIGHQLWALILLAILVLPGWLGTAIFGSLGLFFLFDFLTFRLKARFAIPIAVLTLEDVQMGRFRHLMRVHVNKQLVPRGDDSPTELVMTVVATRRGLTKALSRFPKATPTT